MKKIDGIKLDIVAELGKKSMRLKEILALKPNDILRLDNKGDYKVDILINKKRIARGKIKQGSKQGGLINIEIDEIYGCKTDLNELDEKI